MEQEQGEWYGLAHLASFETLYEGPAGPLDYLHNTCKLATPVHCCLRLHASCAAGLTIRGCFRGFKALKQIVKIHYRLGSTDAMLASYRCVKACLGCLAELRLPSRC